MLVVRGQVFGRSAEGEDCGGLSADAVRGKDELDWLFAARTGQWLSHPKAAVQCHWHFLSACKV